MARKEREIKSKIEEANANIKKEHWHRGETHSKLGGGEGKMKTIMYLKSTIYQ